jgi:hypothetical protein
LLRAAYEQLRQYYNFKFTLVNTMIFSAVLLFYWRFLYEFWFVGGTLLAIGLIAYVVRCRIKKKKPSGFWALFIIISAIVFHFIIIYEFRILYKSDQWVTSSGDNTIRYHPLSILFGYLLMSLLYGYMIQVLRGRTRFPKWTSAIIVIAICAIFMRNTYCLVINYSGNLYHEFYYPELRTCFIGFQPDDSWSNTEGAPQEWVTHEIRSVEPKDGKLVFDRVRSDDYIINEWFLFWKLDTRRWNKEEKARVESEIRRLFDDR